RPKRRARSSLTPRPTVGLTARPLTVTTPPTVEATTGLRGNNQLRNEEARARRAADLAGADRDRSPSRSAELDRHGVGGRGARHDQAIIPPHDLAAERAVLGAVLLEAEALSAAAPLLTPNDFWLDAHRVAWARILA